MWIPWFLRARVDPEGATLAHALARQLEQDISGPELQWIWDDINAFMLMEHPVHGTLRDVCGVVDWWSGRPWEGDAYVLVLVTGSSGGRPRTWTHSAQAKFRGSSLPSSAPTPKAFDVGALVGRAAMNAAA